VLDRQDSEIYSPWLCSCYALFGERDDCFTWADKASGGKRFYVNMFRYSRFFDNVRNDPRFHEIFKRLGLPS